MATRGSRGLPVPRSRVPRRTRYRLLYSHATYRISKEKLVVSVNCLSQIVIYR